MTALSRASLPDTSEAITSGMRHNVRMLTEVATIGGLAGVIATVVLLVWQTLPGGMSMRSGASASRSTGQSCFR